MAALLARAQTFLTEARFRLALLVMVVLRWLMLLLFLWNIPPLDPRNEWLFWPGADQDRIYFAAYFLMRGDARPVHAGIGQIFVMSVMQRLQESALWLRFVRPWTGRNFTWVSSRDIMPELVMVNAFALGGLSIVVVALLARRLTGRRWPGLGAGGLWLLFPYMIWLFTRRYVLSAFLPRAQGPDVAWMNGMPDGPAIFFTLLGTWLAWLCMQERRDWLPPVFGFVLTLAILFKVVMLPAVAWLWLVVAIKNGWRDALLSSAGGALAYVPQAVYNQAAFGFPVATGYFYVGWQPGQPSDLFTQLARNVIPLDPRYVPGTLSTILHTTPVLGPAALLGAAVFALAVVWLWRDEGWHVAALLLTPWPYVALIVTFASLYREPLRFTMLAFPYGFVAAVIVGTGAWPRLKEVVRRRVPA